MTANLVFVLNLIMATVIRFCKKKNLKVKYDCALKVKYPDQSYLIWYLSVKTEVNKLGFIRLRQTQVCKDYEIFEIFFFSTLKSSLN